MVKAGLSLKLSCTITGNPAPFITWGYNEKTLTANNKYNITYKSSLSTFEIMTSEICDSGSYTVTATNHLGSASCSCNVLIKAGNSPSLIFKPLIKSVTSSSVSLEWHAPGSLSVKSYAIQQLSAGEWETVLLECHETTATICGLISDNTYKFRVVAFYENDSKTSEPSDIVKILKGKILVLLF